jgi:excinuclease ABC subunit A
MEGGIKLFSLTNQSGIDFQKFIQLIKAYEIPFDKPVSTFTKKQREIILYGSDKPLDLTVGFKQGAGSYQTTDYVEGVASLVERRHESTGSERARKYYKKFLIEATCETCNGERLNEYALSVRVGDKNISEITHYSIKDSMA